MWQSLHTELGEKHHSWWQFTWNHKVVRKRNFLTKQLTNLYVNISWNLERKNKVARKKKWTWLSAPYPVNIIFFSWVLSKRSYWWKMSNIHDWINKLKLRLLQQAVTKAWGNKVCRFSGEIKETRSDSAIFAIDCIEKSLLWTLNREKGDHSMETISP